jgi:hypothetical protein
MEVTEEFHGITWVSAAGLWTGFVKYSNHDVPSNYN